MASRASVAKGKSLGASAVVVAKANPDAMREGVLAIVEQDWIKGIAEAVRGDGCYQRPLKDGRWLRKPQRWAFRLVAELAKLVGMPQTHILAIIQREVGTDPATAKTAVAAWQEARELTPESRAEYYETWLAEYHQLPVGIMREAIFHARARRLEAHQTNGNGASVEEDAEDGSQVKGH